VLTRTRIERDNRVPSGACSARSVFLARFDPHVEILRSARPSADADSVRADDQKLG